MFRILLCLSCCGAPPSSRPNKVRKSSSVRLQQVASARESAKGQELPGGSPSRCAHLSLEHQESECNQVLANQIQANNDNFGGNKDKQANDSGRPLSQYSAAGSEEETKAAAGDMFGASSSSSAAISKLMERAQGLGGDHQEPEPVQDERLADYAALLGLYEEAASVSPPSSLDIGPFTESLQAAAAATPEEATPGEQQRLKAAARERVNVPSKSKIGDYARIEYSPMDDLESVSTCTRSASRASRSQTGSAQSRRQSPRATQAPLEDGSWSSRSLRRSSGQLGGAPTCATGVESVSMSIASQLSNEQLQQNLAEALEQSACEIALFGTIGLPLGPPLLSSADHNDETGCETDGKTSPETPGAALTSASQDSLSDASLAISAGEANSKTNKAAANSHANVSSPGGGALVPVGDSCDLGGAPIASGEDDDQQAASTKCAALDNQLSKASTAAGGGGGEARLGSPQSLATNATPTPSELSAASQGKKKRLKARAVLKRFKFGSSKKRANEENLDNVS